MFVYVLQAGLNGPIKVGYSAHLKTRMRTLATGAFDALRVLRVIEGSRDTERWMHERFAASWRQGEWFDFHSDMLTVLPPDPDTLRIDVEVKSQELGDLLAEMRQYISQITADLPQQSSVKQRLVAAAERFRLPVRRVRGFWHLEAKSVRADEADRVRLVTRTYLSEHADKLEATAREIRQHLLMISASRREVTANSQGQHDRFTLQAGDQ